MKKISVNAVFNIENPMHDRIVNVSLEIKERYGSDWYLDAKRYPLHLSSYLFAAPEKNRERIIRAAAGLSTKLRGFSTNVEKLVVGKNGLVMIELELTDEIMRYHKEILRVFNPLRENVLRDKQETEEYRSRLSKRRLELIEKYGHQYVLEYYHPHISVALIKDLKKCRKVINKYSEELEGIVVTADRFQLQEAFYVGDGVTSEVDDRTEVIFEFKLHSV